MTGTEGQAKACQVLRQRDMGVGTVMRGLVSRW